MSKILNGEKITLGDTEFVLPGLPLIKIKEADPLMNGGGDILTSEEKQQSLINSVYWSLLRSYPEITREFIEQNIVLTNVGSIVTAFITTNGLVSGQGEA